MPLVYCVTANLERLTRLIFQLWIFTDAGASRTHASTVDCRAANAATNQLISAYMISHFQCCQDCVFVFDFIHYSKSSEYFATFISILFDDCLCGVYFSRKLLKLLSWELGSIAISGWKRYQGEPQWEFQIAGRTLPHESYLSKIVSRRPYWLYAWTASLNRFTRTVRAYTAQRRE